MDIEMEGDDVVLVVVVICITIAVLWKSDEKDPCSAFGQETKSIHFAPASKALPPQPAGQNTIKTICGDK